MSEYTVHLLIPGLKVSLDEVSRIVERAFEKRGYVAEAITEEVKA